MRITEKKKIRRYNTGELFIVIKSNRNENVYVSKKSVDGYPSGQPVEFAISEKGINWDFES